MGMKNRRSIRKPGHDYAEPGDYFVTVCVRNRDPLLGTVDGQKVVLSAMGLIVRQEWTDIPERFPMVRLDEFTIMPNHVHGIITIVGAPLAGARPVDQPGGVDLANSDATRSGLPRVRAGASPAPTPTLGAIIGAFKSLSDRHCRQTIVAEKPQQRFGHLWQRNYHEHIVGDPDELKRIQTYIRDNPGNWMDDPDYVPG
jgi:REP element-mobilizing transposase RayT